MATLSTSINPIRQENENCIYGPFEVDSTYYKYKMTNAPQMHLVFGLTGSYPTIIFLEFARVALTSSKSITKRQHSSGTVTIIKQLKVLQNNDVNSKHCCMIELEKTTWGNNTFLVMGQSYPSGPKLHETTAYLIWGIIIILGKDVKLSCLARCATMNLGACSKNMDKLAS